MSDSLEQYTHHTQSTQNGLQKPPIKVVMSSLLSDWPKTLPRKNNRADKTTLRAAEPS